MREWRDISGLVRGGLIYEHLDGTRAYVHVNDEGDVSIAGSDVVGDGVLSNREALETIIGEDLRRLRESKRGEERAMLWLNGIGDFAQVRSYRGRKKRWDKVELARFAKAFVERGESWALEQWQLERRQALAVMRKAEAARLVKIEKSGGGRSPNIYTLLDDPDESNLPPSPRERAHWHRRSWLMMNDKRAALAANRRKAEYPVTSRRRELAEFADDLAKPGEDSCDGDRRTGHRCSLRAGHEGGHVVLDAQPV